MSSQYVESNSARRRHNVRERINVANSSGRAN